MTVISYIQYLYFEYYYFMNHPNQEIETLNVKGLQQKIPQNHQTTNQQSSSPTYRKPFLVSSILYAAILLTIFVLIMLKNNQVEPILSKLPKVLWVYTHNQLDAQNMVNQTLAHYYIQYGKNLGYEVRIINSWSAYDWLSDEISKKITETMQSVQIDVGVDDLLILAVLIENGGVIAKNMDCIFLDDLKWLQGMFSGTPKQKNWSCQPQKAEIFVSTQQRQIGKDYLYSDAVIAALPQNIFLKQIFNLYRKIMVARGDQLIKFIQILIWNEHTSVYTVKNLLVSCMNMIIQQKNIRFFSFLPHREEDSLCNQLKLQTFTGYNPIIDATKITQNDMLNFLRKERKEIKNKDEIKGKMIIRLQKNLYSNMLGVLLRGEESSLLQKDSILYKILSVPGNRQIFIEKIPSRNVSFCIVIPEQLSSSDIQFTQDKFRLQNYTNWKAVYFSINYDQNPSFQNSNFIIIKSKENKGRKTQIAITKHCPHQSFVLLLNKGEYLSSSTALHQIASKVHFRDVLGGFISLKVNQMLHKPSYATQRFNRVQSAIVDPSIDLLKNASNHFRIFSAEVYKFIPQFDLRDGYGKYYQDPIIFIMTMLDMIRDDLAKIQEHYIIKKYANKFNVPRRVAFFEDLAIITNKISQIDMKQMQKTFTRIETESLHVCLQNLIKYKIPFDKMIVFNEGNEFTPFPQKEGKELIPAIIHQAWLGGQMPPAKQYLYHKTKKMYPKYLMKLWTLQNITSWDFPITYGYLKNLQEFNQKSPFNKFATMADILRHEALYRFGGFWKDAAMHLLRPVFDDFRRYKMVLATDKTLRHRWLQGMCFFGNMKEYPPLWRITNYRNLNRMRVYDNDPMDIAGPIDFRQLIIGRQEYDPDVLILSYETFYPAQLTQHPVGDMCVIEAKGRWDEYEVVEKGWAILKNCSEIYPFAFGLQHNIYGGSWVDRKQ